MEELLYPLLKVPFEKANKSFRLFHKHVSRELAQVQKSVFALQDEQPPAQDARVGDTIDALEAMGDKIRNLQHDAKQFVEEQQKDINSCVLRAQYVQAYQKNTDPLAATAHSLRTSTATTGTGTAGPHTDHPSHHHQHMENDRLIADYLLSHGYIKSSKHIQETKGVEFVVDHDLHMQCRGIMNDLRAHNVSTAISWCSGNGSRLRRLQSQLEFQLRLQDFLELVRSDKKLEAIQYAQTYLTPLSMGHENEVARKEMMEAIQEAMATLAYKSPDQCGVASYSKLFAADRWQFLTSSFRMTFCQVYGISNPPALCVALYAGLSSLNTRTCRRNRDAAAAVALKRGLRDEDEEDDDDSEEADDEASTDGRQRSRSSDQRSKKSKLFSVSDLTTTRQSQAAGKKQLQHKKFSQDEEQDHTSWLSTQPPLCPTCSAVGGKLCGSLPFAHHPHSRLVCRLTQSVMDEHNPPVALPNGYVYSQQAIQQLKDEQDELATKSLPSSAGASASAPSASLASAGSSIPSMVVCPVTKDVFATTVLKPVYIL